MLLDAGADVNAHDTDGMTPLINACKNNYIDVVMVLLTAGADVNKTSYDGMTTPLKVAKERGYSHIVHALNLRAGDSDVSAMEE
jgi:ankyrin repeat protein